MYEGWSFERWDTPISDLKSVAMVSLIDDGHLKITVEDLRDPDHARWRFTFHRAPIYQNILEEYRLELWERVHSGEKHPGWTVTIPSSPWLAQLQLQEPLIEVHDPGLQHYQIGTEDDIVDILSPQPPLIEVVEPGPPGKPGVGKSTILYADEDSPEIEGFLQKLRQRKDDT